MTTPWYDLPLVPPYVVPADAEYVDAFNSLAKPETLLHLALLPEPFLGKPDAPVVLLGLNPGYSVDDEPHHCDSSFIQRSRDNLPHGESKYPFSLLDPAVTAPGNKWWTRKLGALIRQFGLEAVAQRVLCIEYFPYHSRRFGHTKLKLRSQEYSFHLVRNAINRGAVVVVMRSRRHWSEAVAELNGYDRLFELSNRQSPYISPGNCPFGYQHICDSLGQQ
jgi:hypothetical protein